MELGLDPERFWHLCPRELSREFKGAIAKHSRQRVENAWIVWHIAALQRLKTLPSISKLAEIKRAPSKKQSPEVLLAGMKAIFLAFGGRPEELEK